MAFLSVRVRAFVVLVPMLLGLVGGGMSRWIDASAASLAEDSVDWELGELDPTVLEQTPDIDALLALAPPSPRESVESWIAFGEQVQKVDLGSRHLRGGMVSPLLGWYAYIAKHRPEAVYRLYDGYNRQPITRRHLSHFIEVGLALDWYEGIDDPDVFLLGSTRAVASVAVAEGIDAARRRVIDAFFAITQEKAQFFLESLRFALPAMTDDELERVIPELRNPRFQLDSRDFRRLLQGGHLKGSESELLSLIVKHASSSKGQASYLGDGVRLGKIDFAGELIADVADNAQQPTNFYCAACALALTTEGLLGSALVEVVQAGGEVAIANEGSVISLTASSTATQGTR